MGLLGTLCLEETFFTVCTPASFPFYHANSYTSTQPFLYSGHLKSIEDRVQVILLFKYFLWTLKENFSYSLKQLVLIFFSIQPTNLTLPFIKEALSNTDFLYLGWGEEIKISQDWSGYVFWKRPPGDSDMIKTPIEN